MKKNIKFVISIIFLSIITCIFIKLYQSEIIFAASYADELLEEIEEDEDFPDRYYNQVKAAIQSGRYSEEELNIIIAFIECYCNFKDQNIFWDDKYSNSISEWTLTQWKSYLWDSDSKEVELIYDYYWNFAITIPAGTPIYGSKISSMSGESTGSEIDKNKVDKIIKKIGNTGWNDIYEDEDVLEWNIDDWYDYLEDDLTKDEIDILYDYYIYKKFNLTSYKLSKDSIILYSGEEEEIIVIGCRSSIIWKSDNNNIATVNNGVIKAVKPGSTTITAKVGNQSLKCKIEVKKSELTQSQYTVDIGDKVEIKITGSSNDPQFVSSNDAVVKIEKNIPIAVGPGKATLTVTVGSEKFKCNVKVKKKDAPQNIKTISEAKYIKLEWNAVSGASSYSVYIYDKTEKQYKLYSQTKKKTINIKNLEPNTTYFFRIATNVKINGEIVEQKLSDKIECSTIENLNGWITQNNKKYYYKKGHSVGQGLMEIKEKLYIFDKDGALVTEKISYIDGNKYYSNANGVVVCNKDVTDKETGIVYTANSKGVLSEKPFVPTLKDTSEYKVVNSYKYTSGKYCYLVYVVEAKKTTSVEAKLTIKNGSGDVFDTCEDTISLTKGKKNVFILQTYNSYIDYSYKHTFAVRSYNSIWTGDTDAVKVTHYNKSGDRLYISLTQTKEELGSFAKLKMLLFDNGNLVYAKDMYYNVYASEMNHKGDEGVMDINIYGISFDSAEFYYEDR